MSAFPVAALARVFRHYPGSLRLWDGIRLEFGTAPAARGVHAPARALAARP